MVYLDYSATTPVLPEVLDSYTKATKDYMGNANSIHSLGVKSKALLNSATKQICELLNIEEEELIYTSGATESNNMALKGIAWAYEKHGKHIITSKLEHPSIYKICDYLTSIGFEISYVNLDENGLIDLEHLKSLIREDTTLVSICAVNSELGIRQPLKTIKQVIKSLNPNTIFHADITQAIGKIEINLKDVDLASMSCHKIYGPKGIGFLYKNKKVNLIPIIHGSGKVNDLRTGTPPLPLIVSLAKSLRIALEKINEKEHKVLELNEKLCNELSKIEGIVLNKTKYSIPHILNISMDKVRPETMIHALEEEEIYVSTNTACSKGDMSTSIMALYNDEKRATSSIRISLSYITTNEDINKFINVFKNNYKRLYNLGGNNQ